MPKSRTLAPLASGGPPHTRVTRLGRKEFCVTRDTPSRRTERVESSQRAILRRPARTPLRTRAPARSAPVPQTHPLFPDRRRHRIRDLGVDLADRGKLGGFGRLSSFVLRASASAHIILAYLTPSRAQNGVRVARPDRLAPVLISVSGLLHPVATH